MKIKSIDLIKPDGFKKADNNIDGNRFTNSMFTILTCITKIRNKSNDFFRFHSSQRIGKKEQFHQVGVIWVGSWLNNHANIIFYFFLDGHSYFRVVKTSYF